MISREDVLKLGAVEVKTKPFHLRGDLGVGSCLVVATHCIGGGVYGESAYHYFLPVLMWIFSNLLDV